MVRFQEPAEFAIGALAEAAGIGVETVRFYQRRSLLPVPPKRHGARRYGNDALHRLRFIRGAQAAGFNLTEIAELIALDGAADSAAARIRARSMAQTRLAELDARIEEMCQARTALRELATICGAGRDGPCPILHAFGAGAPIRSPRPPR